MPRRQIHFRVAFLKESLEYLSQRRARLAAAFSRELGRRRDQCMEAQVLRGEDARALEADEAMESETARALIRAVAAHPELGRRLRELAGEIDGVDKRLAQVESDLQAPVQAHPESEHGPYDRSQE